MRTQYHINEQPGGDKEKKNGYLQPSALSLPGNLCSGSL